MVHTGRKLKNYYWSAVGNFGRLVDRDVRKIYRYDRPALTLITRDALQPETF